MVVLIKERVWMLEQEVKEALDDMVAELDTPDGKDFFNFHDVMSDHRCINMDADDSPLGVDIEVFVSADLDRNGNILHAWCDLEIN